MAAKRQAVAVAILRDVSNPEMDEQADELIILIFDAIRHSLERAGRPDPTRLRRAIAALSIEEGAHPDLLAQRFLVREALGLLEKVGSGFETGELSGVQRQQLVASVVEEFLDSQLNGEIADVFGRYWGNVGWLAENSVWRIPHALHLEGHPLGLEIVRRLIGDSKAFLFPAQWRGLREHQIVSPEQMNIISMPTGSGKSLLAELIIVSHLHAWTEDGVLPSKRAFFIVPNRALAREKMSELKELFRGLPSVDAKVCQMTGDLLLNADEALRSYNVIVATPEKFDLVLRAPELRSLVGAVVVDEFHNIRDGARGIRLLSTLGRLRHNLDTRSASLHLVSAIVRPEDLEKVRLWMGAGRQADSGRVKAFQSSEPPIFTRCGIFNFATQRESAEWRIEYDDGMAREVPAPLLEKGKWRVNQHGKAAEALALALVGDGPAMLFCTSAQWRWHKRSMQCPPLSIASSLADSLSALPEWVDSAANARMVDDLARLWGEHPLVKAARKGVVAHWGGLPLRGRRIIEQAVSQRGVALLVATSTLAEGVNMPLRRLIIPKCTLRGNLFSVGFFLNLKGRAGRPFLTDEGEVILVASKDTPFEHAKYLASASADDVEVLESPLCGGTGFVVEDSDDEGAMVDVRGVEDAVDGSVLAVVVEDTIDVARAIDVLLVRTTLDGVNAKGEAPRLLKESISRLRDWSLIATMDGCLAATDRGLAVYRTGFSPRDAAGTRETADKEGVLLRLFRELPEKPSGDFGLDALVLLMTLLAQTGSWAQLKRAGLRSPEEAARYLSDWTQGLTLIKIAETRKVDRLYLHSLLEGNLGPVTAWFLFSLSSWLEDSEDEQSANIVIERLQRWAEFACFGAPPGPALRLLRSDFEGNWYRDDAILVCRELGEWDVGRIISGEVRPTQSDLAARVRQRVPKTVDSSERIAGLLLDAGSKSVQKP